MGFLSSLWNGVKSVAKTVFGDHSSHEETTNTNTSSEQTIYEPDRVKVAELENNRMERAIEAQKEIMQMNNEMQAYIMKAHQKGFEKSTKILKDMMVSLNQIAQERLLLIENGHFEVVKKIEKLYLELEKEIREDNEKFNMDKLPQMLEMLSKFEVGSTQAKLYEKSIDKQIELNGTFFTQKLSALHERQKIMVASAIKSKEQILDQSAQIVLERVQFLEKQLQNQQNAQFLPNQPQKTAEYISSNDDVKLIEE